MTDTSKSSNGNGVSGFDDDDDDDDSLAISWEDDDGNNVNVIKEHDLEITVPVHKSSAAYAAAAGSHLGIPSSPPTSTTNENGNGATDNRNASENGNGNVEHEHDKIDHLEEEVNRREKFMGVMSNSNEYYDGGEDHFISDESYTNDYNDDDDLIDDLEEDEDPEDVFHDVNVRYDFGAWSTFRGSSSLLLDSETLAALRQSLARGRIVGSWLSSSFLREEDFLDEEDDEDDEDEEEEERSASRDDVDEAEKLLQQQLGSTEEPLNNNGETNHTKTADDKTNEDVFQQLQQLTNREQLDIATWRMRMDADEKFRRSYIPKRWEVKEMNAIREFLAIENPMDHPEYLNSTHQTQVTREAIRTIFYPRQEQSQKIETNDEVHNSDLPTQSVLLKRGPVLANGEERELFLFTDGFVLSRVVLDDIVDVLLDATSGGRRDGGEQKHAMATAFSNVNGSSSSEDCKEIHEFFYNIMGSMSPNKKTILDKLTKRFKSNNNNSEENETILSFNKFKSILYQIQKDQEEGDPNNGVCFWNELDDATKQALHSRGIARTLDAAYQISDIDRIEWLGDGRNAMKRMKKRMDFDPNVAKLTLAIHLKVTGSSPTTGGINPMMRAAEQQQQQPTPLFVTCSKPGHVAAWSEAFRICTTWQLPNVDWGADDIVPKRTLEGKEEGTADDGALPGNWRCSTIDWGVDDDDDDDAEELKRAASQKERNGTSNWRCSTVDWG